MRLTHFGEELEAPQDQQTVRPIFAQPKLGTQADPAKIAFWENR